MPAVARKAAPESHQNYRVAGDRVPARGSTPNTRRWHESPPGKPGARRTPSRAPSDEADLRGLLDHFSGEKAARARQQQKEVEAQRVARRRARLRHRPFRMTVLAGAMAGAPLALLACLLWIRSSSLALSREDRRLQDAIAQTRAESVHTRQEITAVNASPQVEEWAKERGWRRAGQNDFDQVSRDQVSRDQVSRIGKPDSASVQALNSATS